MAKDYAMMDIGETKTLVKLGFKRRVSGLKSKPIMILGHKGIGKTQIIDQCARELSEELKVKVSVRKVDLTYFEAPEIRGLSEVRDDKNGNRKTYSAPPEDLFPTDDNEYSIVLLDEVNRVDDKGVKASMLTLFDEYRVSNTILSKNCFIVCLGNPSSEDTEGNDMYENIQILDAAISDRLKMFHMTSSPAAVFGYLGPKYKESKVLKAFTLHPEMLGFDGTKVSPRQLESAIIDTLDWSVEMASLELRATFGNKTADAILKIIKDEVEGKALPGIEDFLNQETAKSALVFMRDNASRGDYTDMLIQQSLIKMEEWKNSESPVKKTTAQAFLNMVLALPKDKIMSLFHQSTKRNQQLQLFALAQKAGIAGDLNYYSDLGKVLSDVTSKKSQPEVA